MRKRVNRVLREIVYPRGVDSAKVIPVIETTAARGSGEQKQPSRIVTQYWSLDGKLLAERDPYLREMLPACSTDEDIRILVETGKRHGSKE